MLDSDGIGRENLIDKIVYLNGKPRGVYADMSLFDLALELKIVKIHAGY